MDTPVNLHQIQLFNYVVEYGSYTQAAQSLHMTQPALSMQIKSLENKFGAKLFVRKGNNIELTEVGTLVHQYASQLLSLDKQLRSTLKELISGEAGEISIGSNRPIGRFLLPQYILNFMKQYPKLELTTHYDNTKQICQYVLEEKINAGFVMFSNEQAPPPGLVTYLIQKDHWVLVCAAGSEWAAWNGSIQEILKKAPLIGSLPKTAHGEIIEIELQKLGLNLSECNISLRLDEIESIKMAVISQLGIGFLPRMTIERELKNGELTEVPITNTYKAEINNYMIMKEDVYLPPTINTFKNFILENAAENLQLTKKVNLT
ncbi:LysR family transcriptional regulator [Bacillus tuaregi]|uniref:LysR family transcriptional regulator n=1 Tax=Bacillus tuaregi TaxID=1816695 RepID=UPI0008F92926|nr:LysR family transcriptional regulator [Bacillus tuaregi]